MNGSPDPFAGITMPDAVLVALNRRLTAIEHSADTLSVQLTSERAQGVVEALEVLKVLKPAEIESLYLLFENTAQARVQALLL